jgi:hypothetical protein
VIIVGKGSRREREAADLYQRAGYATYRPATVRFGENDVFGLFDILAIAPDGPFRAVQVKSNKAVGVRAWMAYTALWRAHGVVTEYVVPVDGEGWRLLQPRVSSPHGESDHNGPSDAETDGSYRTVYDERKDERVGPNVDTPLGLGDGLVEFLRPTGGTRGPNSRREKRESG